ncbi:MAG: DUF2934 domain-containing protein [Acidobacteria bacterium]|nr:DUF2934 domain-containing protein [Acidobacteriota bacterium]
MSKPTTHAVKASKRHRQPNGASTEEEIRVRAYFLSLERGSNSGSPFDDWIQAESELRQHDAGKLKRSTA